MRRVVNNSDIHCTGCPNGGAGFGKHAHCALSPHIRNFRYTYRAPSADRSPMAIEGAAASQAPASNGVMDKGLKKGAISYISNIVIGVASTAPAYSIAATLGFIVAVKGVGIYMPAVRLVSSIPALLTAVAYKSLTRAAPAAGPPFAWPTRAKVVPAS